MLRTRSAWFGIEKYVFPLSFLEMHAKRVQCMGLQSRVFCKHHSCLFVPLQSVTFRRNPFQGHVSLKATFLMVFFLEEQKYSAGDRVLPWFFTPVQPFTL